MRGFFARVTGGGGGKMMDGGYSSPPQNELAQMASSSSSSPSVNDDARAKALHEEAARRVLTAMASPPTNQLTPPPPPPMGMPARGGNLSAVRGEEAFQRTLWEKGRDGLVVVKFGASWCTHCAGMLPEFGAASREYPDAHFVLADVDTLPETAADIRYTPTFSFYQKGRKVDEITKTNPRGLRWGGARADSP
jgi:thioredoxin 1